MDAVVLCQECLAVSPYSDSKHNEDEFCDCGGQWCGCPTCAGIVVQLRRGERRPEVLGYDAAIPSWCEEIGIRGATASQEAIES